MNTLDNLVTFNIKVSNTALELKVEIIDKKNERLDKFICLVMACVSVNLLSIRLHTN